VIDHLRRVLAIVALISCCLVTLGSARAAEFEIFIDANDEDDLYELYATDQISEGTYLALIDVLRRGTDLSTATRDDLYALPNLTYADVDRILDYRKEAGAIRDPAALVSAGVLSRRKLAAIAPFIVIGEALQRRPVNGYARYQSVWTVGDKRPPAMMLQARLNALRYLTVGFTGRLTRDRIGRVAWDPNREALSAAGPKPRVDLPKAYIQWDTPEYGVIAGSYRIGFGQRLTFDNSGRYTPNGFYLDDAMYYRVRPSSPCRATTGELEEPPCDDTFQAAPDHKIRYGLLGVAAGAKHIKLPVGWLQIYGFFSYQPRSIYQYQIYDPGRCNDPTVDDDDACSAPDVYQRSNPLLAASNELSFTTLPDLFALALGGGNFTYFHDRRTRVGVTGYGAAPRWLVKGADVDFQEWSPFPYGGAFGAVGLDMSWGHRWADLFAEVSRSFDSQPGAGGGYAGLVRHTATFDNHEVEVSARFYDQNYENPFARPIAAVDQNEGLRASDEAGGRVRYNAFLAKRVDLRTFFDVWTDLEQTRPQVRTYARADVDATKWFRPGLRVEVQDRDVRTRSFGECYYTFQSSSVDAADENDAPTPDDPTDDQDADEQELCTGERYAIMARARFQPAKQVWFALQYMHEFIDDTNYPADFRQDATAVFTLATRPIEPLTIRFRMRYRSDDIRADDRLEEVLWGYVDISYRIRRWLTPRIRYDVYGWLDQRESTALRHPNPVHWLWFELESRF
jgi:hypothetical protein